MFSKFTHESQSVRELEGSVFVNFYLEKEEEVLRDVLDQIVREATSVYVLVRGSLDRRGRGGGDQLLPGGQGTGPKPGEIRKALPCLVQIDGERRAVPKVGRVVARNPASKRKGFLSNRD